MNVFSGGFQKLLCFSNFLNIVIFSISFSVNSKDFYVTSRMQIVLRKVTGYKSVRKKKIVRQACLPIYKRINLKLPSINTNETLLREFIENMHSFWRYKIVMM